MVSAVLQRPTLMLNRNWQPVGVATVSRSLVMVWNGTARVVDPNDYQLYTWADWAALKPSEDDLVIHTVGFGVGDAARQHAQGLERVGAR